MTEQGPFHVAPDGSLLKNPYAWNEVANMLFVEQPVGVGFSWSGDDADYTMGDWDAARDNFAAIQTFLGLFPQYAANDLYLTAESYGGHYMPTLAKYIVDHDPDRALLNFKGFAVGNPFTSKVSNQVGEFTTLWGHQLVSTPRYNDWVKDCGLMDDADSKGYYAAAKAAELAAAPGEAPASSVVRPYQCLMDEEIMLGSVELQLNVYALDYPTCPKAGPDGRGSRFGAAQRLAFLRHTLGEDRPELLAAVEAELLKRHHGRRAEAVSDHGGSASSSSDVPTVRTDASAPEVGEYLPCTDDYATAYLNQLPVQQALHVHGGASLDNGTLVDWSECSRRIHYNMTDSRTPMMPLYSYLLNATHGFGLKLLVYSGDDDMVCSTSGSQEWVYDLGFDTKPERAWHSWHYDDDNYGRQVAGFVANFQDDQMSGHFAFVTAHGCGHEVPTYKPQLALELFKNYLNGTVYL